MHKGVIYFVWECTLWNDPTCWNKKRYAFTLFLVLAVNMVGVCELNSRANRRQISHFSFLTGLKKKNWCFSTEVMTVYAVVLRSRWQKHNFIKIKAFCIVLKHKIILQPFKRQIVTSLWTLSFLHPEFWIYFLQKWHRTDLNLSACSLLRSDLTVQTSLV